MKKTNRTIPIYPRVALTNRAWLGKTAKKFKMSESAIIDSLLGFYRSNGTIAKAFKNAKTGNGISRKASA